EDKTYQSRSAFITGAGASERSAAELTTGWLRHSLVQALDGVSRRDTDRCSFIVGYTADGSQHLEEAIVLAGVAARLAGVLTDADGTEPERTAIRDGIMRALEERYWRGARNAPDYLP